MTFLIRISYVFAILALSQLTQWQKANAEVYTNWKNNFRIEFDPKYELKERPADGVAVLFRQKQTGFPTFNVIKVPGSYKALTTDLEIQKKRLIDEYALVGIKRTNIQKTYIHKVAGRNACTIELHYWVEDKDLIASVTRIGGVNEHYILTYIDKASTFLNLIKERDHFIEKFTIIGKDSNIEENTPQISKLYLGWGLILLGLIAFGLYLYMKRHHVKIS